VPIDCPGCARAYHISRQALGSHGRKVACPHCGSRWFVAADAQTMPESEEGPDFFASDIISEAPEITAEATSARPRQPTYEELYGTPKARRVEVQPHPLHVSFRLPPGALGFAAAIGLVMAAIGLRGPIVKVWPKANAAYALAGMPVNQRGLDLKNIQVKLIEDGAQSMLVVEGEITNRRAHSAKVPDLRLALRDPAGQEVYSWDTSAPKTKLEAGETIAFRARLATPPSGGRELFVRFASADPAQK